MMLGTETQAAIQRSTGGHVEPEPLSLDDLAEREYERAGGIVSDAASALAEILAHDDDLRISVAEQIIKEASESAIRRRLMADRVSVIRYASNGATRASVSALASGVARSILDFPLSDGTRLRDATRADVERQVTRYQSMATEITKRAAWLVAILDLMGNAKTVGDAVSDDVALELFRSA